MDLWLKVGWRPPVRRSFFAGCGGHINQASLVGLEFGGSVAVVPHVRICVGGGEQSPSLPRPLQPRFPGCFEELGHALINEQEGNCWDNAPTESFWGRLKTASLYGMKFATRREAIRTARSRNSGEYFPDFLMAPSSQRMETPQIPGRFTTKVDPRVNPVGRA